MAFSFDESSSSGSGRRRFRRNAPLSEMNIVPLVDVVLVLLVIFMLTAHVMDFGLEVDVPKVKETTTTTRELPVISVRRNGDSYLNDKPVNIHLLGQEVRRRFPKADSVYLRGDKATVFDAIAHVIDALNQAHFKVEIVLTPEDQAGKS